MKTLKAVLLSLCMLFLMSSVSQGAVQCKGKAAKVCMKMKGCQWDKKANSCQARMMKKPAAAKKPVKAPEPAKEDTMEDDMGGDEHDMGAEEDEGF